MKKYLRFMFLCCVSLVISCESNTSGSGVVIKPLEPIADNVIRLSNGSNDFSNIPNKSASIITYSIPNMKSESMGESISLVFGTLGYRSKDGSVPADLSENVNQKISNIPHSKLFSPYDRKRLMDAGSGSKLMIEPNMKGFPRNVFKEGDIWKGINVLDWSKEDIEYLLIDAKCIGVSDSAYFMQEEGQTNISPNILKEYMDKFDHSYKTIGENLATESDVDSNGKIIVLFYNARSDTTCGYFDNVDKEDGENSNRADMVYVNISFAASELPRDIELVNFTLAHEFQHMVYSDSNFSRNNENYTSSTWLDEGLAMLAGYLSGYYHDGKDEYIDMFIRSHDKLSLTNWADSNYGYVMLFTVYLYDRFGIEAIKRIYTATPTTGWGVVEEVTGMDFNQLFGDFVIALVISGRGYSEDPKYNFKGINFKNYETAGLTNLKPLYGYLQPNYDSIIGMYPYGLDIRATSYPVKEILLKDMSYGFAVIEK